MNGMKMDGSGHDDAADPFEVIGAFLDGEVVDPHALKHALSSDQGRQYLVDVVSLREMAGEHVPSAQSSTAPAAPAPVRWARRLVAAAAVLVCVGGAYVVGHRTAIADSRPGTAPSAAASASGAVKAPQPTVVIKLEPGVDWHETTGGN